MYKTFFRTAQFPSCYIIIFLRTPHLATIQGKNEWPNGKMCGKVAFLRYTESVKFGSQNLKTAWKQKPHRGLGTRMVFWIGLYIACGVRDNTIFRSCPYNFCPWLQKESFFFLIKRFQASLEHLNLPGGAIRFLLRTPCFARRNNFPRNKIKFPLVKPFFNSL